MGLLSSSPSSSPTIELNEWIFETIQPYLKGRVLELNSALDTISTVFVKKKCDIHLSTPDKTFREALRAYYKDIQYIKKVHSINTDRVDFAKAYPFEKACVFDTILVLKAIERGQFNNLIIRNARHLLKERGRLILLAPVITAAYGDLELDQNQLNKFDRASLKRMVTEEMDILMTRYFNLPRSSPYDHFGLSVLVVARKNTRSERAVI